MTPAVFPVLPATTGHSWGTPSASALAGAGREKFLLLLLLLFGSWACRRLELTPLDFFTVSTRSVARQSESSVGVVVVAGELDNTEGQSVSRCGFVWSEDLAAISVPQPLGLKRLEAVLPPAGDRDFSVTFGEVRAGVPVYFRAFAEGETAAGQRLVYAAEVKAFTLGEMVAMAETEPLVRNDQVTVQARLTGWNVLVAHATRHGFVYTTQSPQPRLGQAGSTDVVVSSQPALDYAFTGVLPDLAFNTDYFIRAYALTDADTFYSTVVKKASVTDGWKRLAQPMPSLHADGVVAVHQGRAYLGLGCRESGLCLPNVLTKVYQEFDPAGPGGWTPLASLPGPDAPTNAVSVTLQDSVFVLFGGYQLVFGGTLFQVALQDFYKYLPGSNEWVKMPDPPADIKARTGAAGFVVNDRIYVGTGFWEDPADDFRDYYVNDFWEFNPRNQKWRPVASLPARYGGTLYPNQGRYEAACFTLNGRAFVGGGYGDYRSLRDFWEFVPPMSNTDPGSWKYVGDFEGKSRIEAVSYAIGGKGYYGLGYHFAEGSEPFAYYLDDWWEFTPDTPQPWRQRTIFPGGARSRSLGFGTGSSGYVGGGLVTRLDSTQTIITEGLLPDFWKYTPAKQ